MDTSIITLHDDVLDKTQSLDHAPESSLGLDSYSRTTIRHGNKSRPWCRPFGLAVFDGERRGYAFQRYPPKLAKLDESAAKKRRDKSGLRVQAFKASFTALAGEKESFFDAAIVIFSPLAGLRPSRFGESLTLNFPNPAKETSSSLAAALTMLFNTLSRIACACAFDMS
jgi:hypothetical protein